MTQTTLSGCLWRGPCDGKENYIFVVFVLVIIIVGMAFISRRYRTGKHCVAPDNLLFISRLFLLALFFLAFGLQGLLIWLIVSFLFGLLFYLNRVKC